MKVSARRGHGLLLAIVIAARLALPAGPCDAATDSRLAARLDPETAAQVGELVEQARERGLPSEALVARALEGATRQALGPRIVTAVRNLLGALERAQEAMGNESTPAELVAGAAALSAGVAPDTLASLRRTRRPGSLVVPLVVLADLVSRRVPVETASATVLAATRAGVRDPELMKLRQRIGQDIRGGASPANATILRTRSLVRGFEGPPVDPGAPGHPRGTRP